MTLNTTTSKVDGVFVVYLSGAILFGEESASLRNLCERPVEQIQPNRARSQE